MGLLPAESIKVIAESIGISALPDDIAGSLAQDIEYRLRDIVQEALKFMRHAKRSRLSTEDINHALKVRNVEPLYGFSSTVPVSFKSAPGSNAFLFYLDDDELDFDDVINAPMPKIPLETTFTAHWLAIEGVQPSIAANPAPIETRIELLSKRLKAEGKFDLADKKTEVKPLIRHVLTKELQIFYEKIAEALLSDSEGLRETALQSLKEDHGIQQLLPYFIQFLTEQISKNLKNLQIVSTMVLVVESILSNAHFFIEPYLHQLMPPILSCLVSKRLCESATEDHWSVRIKASALMSRICQTYGHSYDTLQPRVTRTLLRAFLDPLKALTTHFGAIIGLASLGPSVIRALLIPNMKTYLGLIANVDADGDEVKRLEASKCRDALKAAALSYLEYEVSKKRTNQPSQQGSNEMDVDQTAVDWNSVEHAQLIFEIFGEEVWSERTN